MIARLAGLVDSVDEDGVVVDVRGVGYLVFCPARTLSALPAPGEAVTLLIETHVREDHIHLYGFSTTAERDWFRLLMTVQGVGARVALAVLGVLSPTELMQAVAAQDRAAVSRAQGVGGKLAQRIVNELKDKAGAMPASVLQAAGGRRGTVAEGASGDMAVGDAVSALVNLGFGRSEAFGVVAAASRKLGAEATAETLIRAGLQELHR
ncbi:MAG: Holliday junction branch migration protein RuvA [Acetobacterales bacterium]